MLPGFQGFLQVLKRFWGFLGFWGGLKDCWDVRVFGFLLIVSFQSQGFSEFRVSGV